MKALCVFGLLFSVASLGSWGSLSSTATASPPEHWSAVSEHTLKNLFDTLFRSQGMATDDKGNYWFSSRFSLTRTSSIYGEAEAFHALPIPPSLVLEGENHIGDIDVVGDKLFAGIEDGPKHKRPYIGVFNANTLEFERAVAAPFDLQTDGVPWIAADPANTRLLTSHYHQATVIHVFDIDTLEPIGQIPLANAIDEIQGAKVLDGYLYVSADAPGTNKAFAVYKIDLATGVAAVVANLPSSVTEVEGLAFTRGEASTTLDVMGVVPTWSGTGKKSLFPRMELFHFVKD